MDDAQQAVAAVEPRPALHSEEDLNNAWRVWYSRREPLTQYLVEVYGNGCVDASAVRSLITAVEVWTTCSDDNFAKHVLGHGVAPEAVK